MIICKVTGIISIVIVVLGVFQIKLSESLVSSLALQPAGREMEVAWVDGCVTFPMDTIEATGEEADRQGFFFFFSLFFCIYRRYCIR